MSASSNGGPPTGGSSTRERGTLFANKERIEMWQRVYRIAHEDGRGEAGATVLLEAAMRLALGLPVDGPGTAARLLSAFPGSRLDP